MPEIAETILFNLFPRFKKLNIMKTVYRLSFYIAILFTSLQSSWAQIDLQCNGRDMHSIYLISSSGYYRIDSVDTNPTNPIFLLTNQIGNIGISINNFLGTGGGPLTMYSCYSIYYYWNGTGWTNTGHATGNSTTVNPGGSANYIFNIDDNGNSLYRYDGTISTLVLSNITTPYDFIHDIATDNLGNFYLFYTNAQKIVAYTPNGIPIDSFSTNGFLTGSNCGFAILGNRVYAQSCGSINELYEGIKSGNTFNFTMIKSLGLLQSPDIAACPDAALPLAVFKDPDQPRFAVHPNPAQDVALISLIKTSQLEIYNSMGILIKSVPTRGLTEYQLDVSEWKAGVYLINAFSEKKTAARGKLIVE